MKHLKDLIEKYKNASEDDKEFYQETAERIALVLLATSIPIIVYVICNRG